ncbi:MAG: hypothetical protein VXA88_12535 [Rhodospirillales bacterium]
MKRPKARPYSPTPRMSAGARAKDTFNKVKADIGGRPLTAISRGKITGEAGQSEGSKKVMADLERKSSKDRRERNRRASSVNDAAAKRLAEEKAAGQRRRKKFEEEKGEKTKKRRALLLNIEKAKK